MVKKGAEEETETRIDGSYRSDAHRCVESRVI